MHGKMPNPFMRIIQLVFDQEYQKTIYDAEFLMMLVINNHELVQVDSNEEDGDTKIKFDIKSLIDSNLLQFIVVSLSSYFISINQEYF